MGIRETQVTEQVLLVESKKLVLPVGQIKHFFAYSDWFHSHENGLYSFSCIFNTFEMNGCILGLQDIFSQISCI